jgi:hypothetical protein
MQSRRLVGWLGWIGMAAFAFTLPFARALFSVLGSYFTGLLIAELVAAFLPVLLMIVDLHVTADLTDAQKRRWRRSMYLCGPVVAAFYFATGSGSRKE